MGMEGVVVKDRLLLCVYMYDITFLWMKRHLPVRLPYLSRLLRSSWS